MLKRLSIILILAVIATPALTNIAEPASIDLPYYRTDVPELTRFTNIPEAASGKLDFPIELLTPEREELLKARHAETTQFMLVGTVDGELGKMNITDNEDNFKAGNPTMNPGVKYPEGIYQDGRIILYLKGLIKGKYLLTTRIDSTKDNQDHLFRNINPERYYPVYGDESILTDDADSQGKIFAKIERDSSYAELGNYSTEEFEKTQLSRYNRVLSGVKTHYRTEDFKKDPDSADKMFLPQLRLTNFFANTTQDETEDNFSGQGISGPFYLTKTPVLEYTERIRIETRDKNKSDTVLNTRYLIRDEDYSVEYDNGRIFFHEPIPSYDENNDPVYIIVRYEYSANTDLDYDIMGNRLEGYLFPRKDGPHRLMLAAQTVHEQRDLFNWAMYSTDAILHLTPNIRLAGEYARSDKSDAEPGEAARAEGSAKFFNDKLMLQAYVAEIDPDFFNATNVDETGVQKYGALANIRLTDNLSIIADNWASYSMAAESYDRSTSIDGIFDYKNLFLSLGYRLKEFVAEGEALKDTHTHGIELTQGLSFWDKFILSVTALYERQYEFDLPFVPQEKLDYKKDTFTLSPRIDVRMANDIDLYIRHDLITNFSYSSVESGLYDSNTTAIGISRITPEGVRSYVEYGFTGEGANTTTIGQEANLPITDRMTLRSYMNTKILPYHTTENIGYNSKIRITDNLYTNLNFERNKVENNKTISDYNSQSASLEYITEENTIGGKFEHRDENATTRYSLFTNASINVFDGLRVLEKTEFTRNRDKDTNQTQENYQRALVGFAYRPVFSNSLNFLGKYEFKKNLYQDATVPLDTYSHLGSIEGIFAPLSWINISGKYAIKHYTETSDNLTTPSLTDMLSLRPCIKFGEYLDLTGIYRYIRSYDIKTAKHIASLETGLTLFDHLRLACGYNFVQYDDGDMPDEEYKGYGPYVNFSLALLEPGAGADEFMQARIEGIKARMIKKMINNLSQQEKESFNKKYREAETLYKQGKYKEAKALYDKIVLKMSLIKLDTDEWVEAKIEKEKEILALFNQAELLYRKGKYKEAKKLYKKIRGRIEL
jgi:hypothetical protein